MELLCWAGLINLVHRNMSLALSYVNERLFKVTRTYWFVPSTENLKMCWPLTGMPTEAKKVLFPHRHAIQHRHAFQTKDYGHVCTDDLSSYKPRICHLPFNLNLHCSALKAKGTHWQVAFLPKSRGTGFGLTHLSNAL